MKSTNGYLKTWHKMLRDTEGLDLESCARRIREAHRYAIRTFGQGHQAVLEIQMVLADHYVKMGYHKSASAALETLALTNKTAML